MNLTENENVFTYCLVNERDGHWALALSNFYSFSSLAGWNRGGTVMRNTRALFHQPKWQCSIVHYVYQNMLGGSIRAQLRQVRSSSFMTC